MMRVNTISRVYDLIKEKPRKRIAVAQAADAEVLSAVCRARELKLADAVLIGEPGAIRRAADHGGLDVGGIPVCAADTDAACAEKAAAMVAAGEADVPMKGLLESSVFLRAIFKEKRLKKDDGILHAVAVLEYPQGDRLLFLTDPGFIPLPDLETKKALIRHTVEAVQRFYIERPVVAALAASEQVNPHIPLTAEARQLQDAGDEGALGDCQVIGPVSLDIALSESMAQHKRYLRAGGGKADILLVPNLESGNMLYKSMMLLAGMRTGGMVLGATAPIIFTSRSDTAQTKLDTIALALFTA